MTACRYAKILWAARELLTRPGVNLLMAFSVGLLATMITTGLLLSQALTTTTAHLLAEGPDLVVRRVTAGGWQSIDAQATAQALTIPGITDARPRIWGTVRAPQGPVTIAAADQDAITRWCPSGTLRVPDQGEAIIGRGITFTGDPGVLTLQGESSVRVRVVQRFPEETDLMTHDLVLLHPRDTRRLLGLAPGDASDLALGVFHPDEAEALLPELARAFPFPVHIATREDARKHYAAAFGRRGGLGLLLYAPAIMALVLLVAGIVRQQIGDRARVGLLKALGWTSRDIVALQVTKALLVGLPAIAIGLTAAYGLVYGPSRQWIGFLLLGWQENAPLLHLEAGHAAPIFLEVTGILLAPFLAAVLWSSLVQAASDPQDLLSRGN